MLDRRWCAQRRRTRSGGDDEIVEGNRQRYKEEKIEAPPSRREPFDD